MLGSHFRRLLTLREIPFAATDYAEVDITNLEHVQHYAAKEKFSHIINCAAYTQVDKAETDKEKAFLINAKGPQNLGIAARRINAQVMHFSTDYVFDGSASIPYKEEDPCSPTGVYASSKLEGEHLLFEELPEACVIRTSWLFGYPGNNFVNTMLRLMKDKESLRVVQDQQGKPTYCQDLVEAAMNLLDNEGIFHFANSRPTTWHGFAEEIRIQALDLGFPIRATHVEPISSSEYPTPAKRPVYSVLNTFKIEKTLGIAPRPWQEALRDYLIHYKRFQELEEVTNYDRTTTSV